MRSAILKPNAVIIGLGSYFSKLRKGIEEHFNVLQLVDCQLIEKLKLALDDRAKFHRVSEDLYGLPIDDSTDCIMLLTPPAFHVPHLELLTRFEKPILVEKPLTTSSTEIPQIQRIMDKFSKLYCSDFYPDVRAVPLISWFHPERLLPLKSKLSVIEGDKELWQGGLSLLGKIEKVEGKLLEGSGPARSFEGRDWLWDPLQGGVLRDLMYHYFTLSSFLFDKDLIPESVILKTLAEDGQTVPWNSSFGKAETYALVEGRFTNNVPFSFEVAKYWGTENERWFSIYFTSGFATMLFKNPNILLLESKNTKCSAYLEGDYYEHVSLCFSEYIKSPESQPHGLTHAVRAIESIDRVKKMI